jgi:hypothetical protein
VLNEHILTQQNAHMQTTIKGYSGISEPKHAHNYVNMKIESMYMLYTHLCPIYTCLVSDQRSRFSSSAHYQAYVRRRPFPGT